MPRITPPGLLMFTFLAARLFHRVSPRSSTVADTAGFCAGVAGTGSMFSFTPLGVAAVVGVFAGLALGLIVGSDTAPVLVAVRISASSICVSPVAVVDTSGIAFCCV